MSVSDVFNAVNTFKNPLGQLGQVRQAVSGVTNTIGDIQRVFGIGGNKNPASFGGTYNVMSSMSARKDPLPSWCWLCFLPSVNGTSVGWEYVEEFTGPLPQIEVQNQYRTGKTYHYASTWSYDSISLKLYEDTSGISGTYLSKWQKTIMDETTGTMNYPVNYKKPITLVLLDVTRQVRVSTYNYYGCWPTSVDQVAVTSESGRIVRGANFSVDGVSSYVESAPASLLGNVAAGSSPTSFLNQVFDAMSGANQVFNVAKGITGAVDGTLSRVNSVLKTPFKF